MGKPYSRSFVLITGATTGIGFELAKLYANEGRNLILVARNAGKLQEVRQELNILYNVTIYTLDLDLTVNNSCEEIFNFVDKKNISVDILINNAGMGSFGYLSEIELEKEMDLINLNIKALTELTKLFLPSMIEHEEGGIMNVSSTAAFCSGPKMAVYYASKAYVLSLTEAIHEEVRGKGIKVSCLCPGPVNTKFQEKAKIKKKWSSNRVMMSAKETARIGYKNFKKGKLIIIPGFRNKAMVLINKFIPRSISRKIILIMNKG